MLSSLPAFFSRGNMARLFMGRSAASISRDFSKGETECIWEHDLIRLQARNRNGRTDGRSVLHVA
jgi:hypothetical protein